MPLAIDLFRCSGFLPLVFYLASSYFISSIVDVTSGLIDSGRIRRRQL